jgi:predicted amidophosphoribosyltransferase
MLVDDVMTTGATLNEAARRLTNAGSGPVSALVLARVTGLSGA